MFSVHASGLLLVLKRGLCLVGRLAMMQRIAPLPDLLHLCELRGFPSGFADVCVCVRACLRMRVCVCVGGGMCVIVVVPVRTHDVSVLLV